VRRQLEAADRAVTAIDLTARAEPGAPVTALDVRDIHRLHALAVQAGPFEAIIHCGALSGPMLARDNPHFLIDVNLGGTANLLELARIHRIPRVVFCSSVSAYGHTPAGLSPVGEDVPLEPTTVYGATKAAGEALVRGYATQHGVSAVCIRIGWVYGPRRTTDCDIRDMILAAQSGRPFAQPVGADDLRQYVYMDDVAAALILAADVSAPPRLSYSVTGDDIRPLSAVADIVRARFPGASIEIGAGAVPGADRQQRFDLSAARRDLGYRPSTNLTDGIAAYADWLAARPG
jgi:UDP-glucose 4-epimerase/UDP-glucuronate 4-epimerase